MDVRTQKVERFAPLALAIIVVIAFLPTLHDGFVSLDDRRNFIDNDAFRGLGATHLRWMWTTTLMGHYVPLSWMTLGLDYVLWGMNPAGYHLTNLVLHAGNAVLVYFVARRLLGANREHESSDEPRRLVVAAAMTALLFALHPLRVESVAWVTERRDVLSYLFFLASVLAYLRSIDRAPARPYRYWLAVGLFACSALSKATAMTLPAVLLIINVYPLRRVGGAAGWWSDAARRIYLEMIPFAVIALGTALTSIMVLHPPEQLPMPAKVAVSAYSLVFYLWKTIAPIRLSPMYEMPERVDPLAGRFLASYAIVIAAGLFLWAVRRTRPGLTACVLAFMIITLPMLGIVQNGPQIAADRYTYFGAPALAIAAAGWLYSYRRAPRFSTVFTGAILVGLGALTWNQTTVWHDSETLWSYVARVDENSSFAQVGLAMLASDRGDLDGAIRHYRRAVEIRPQYDEGFNNLGNALMREGKIDLAIGEYRHALALNASFPEARNDLGSALAQQGNFPEAIEQYRQALALKPEYAEAHNNWGVALARTGDLEHAIEQYQLALAIDSTYADAGVNWGNALVRLGKPALAEPHYEAALKLRPDDADIHRNLGVALAQERRMAEAADHFRRALALRPDDDELKAYLAAALRSGSGRTSPR